MDRVESFTGSSDWVPQSLSLADYAGMDIELRFRLTSDGRVTRDGWYLDELSIGSVPSVQSQAKAAVSALSPVQDAMVMVTVSAPGVQGTEEFRIPLTEEQGEPGIYRGEFAQTKWVGDYGIRIDIIGASLFGFGFSRTMTDSFEVEAGIIPTLFIRDSALVLRAEGTSDATFAKSMVGGIG